jgi:hypothetical protein
MWTVESRTRYLQTGAEGTYKVFWSPKGSRYSSEKKGCQKHWFGSVFNIKNNGFAVLLLLSKTMVLLCFCCSKQWLCFVFVVKNNGVAPLFVYKEWFSLFLLLKNNGAAWFLL